MATIRFGAGIVDARGSIGGTVFSRNRGGAYIRARTAPINPNTPRQGLVRADLSNVVALWSDSLSQANRDQWGVYAAAIPRVNRLGETIFWTGFNTFVGNNTMRLQNDLPVVSIGPATLSLPVPDSDMSASASVATQLVTVNFTDSLDWAGEDSAAMQIRMGIPVPATRNFFNGPYRIAGTLEGNTAVPLTSPQTLPVPFPVQLGQKVFVQGKITRADGRVSNDFRDDAIAGA